MDAREENQRANISVARHLVKFVHKGKLPWLNHFQP